MLQLTRARSPVRTAGETCGHGDAGSAGHRQGTNTPPTQGPGVQGVSGRAASPCRTQSRRDCISAPSALVFSVADHAVSSTPLLHVWRVGGRGLSRASRAAAPLLRPPLAMRFWSGRYAGIGVRASCICVRIAQKCVSALLHSGALMPASVRSQVRRSLGERPRAVSQDRASDRVWQGRVVLRVNTNTDTNGGSGAVSASKRATKIAELEEKLRQLKAREQAVEARRRSLESRRARKADTRRKILVGAVVLARVERGEIAAADLRGWLDAALTREDDRQLFNLTGGTARASNDH